MQELSVELFGGFRATRQDQHLLNFRTRKTSALLVYLITEEALHQHSFTQSESVQHDRQALMSMLWPEFEDASAQNNLRQTLYNLRQAIPRLPSREDQATPVPFVLSDRSAVWLNPEASYRSDVKGFLDLLFEYTTLHCEATPDVDPGCVDLLERAAALYKGSFLADHSLAPSEPFQEWSLVWEESFRRKARRALAVLTAAYVRQHDSRHAVASARAQIRIDDLDESAYRQLMGVLALTGHRSDALLLYDDLCRRLSEALGVDPEQTTRTLHQAILEEALAWPCLPADASLENTAPPQRRFSPPSGQQWVGADFTCA